MLTRSAYVPQADSKPCLLCSLQNAVIMHSFTPCGRGGKGSSARSLFFAPNSLSALRLCHEELDSGGLLPRLG